MTDKLDIAMCESAIAGHSYGDCRDRWFLQAIPELKAAREELEWWETVWIEYENMLEAKDARIAELEAKEPA